MPLTWASALVKSPFNSRPPLKRWKMPVKCPSPPRTHFSRAKKISRIRGKSTTDLTCHVCSGHRDMSTVPVASERDPSERSCNWLNLTSGPSMVKTPSMSVFIGRYCWMSTVPFRNFAVPP